MGLLLAGGRSRYGARVVLADRLASPMTESRASQLTVRTMELLDPARSGRVLRLARARAAGVLRRAALRRGRRRELLRGELEGAAVPHRGRAVRVGPIPGCRAAQGARAERRRPYSDSDHAAGAGRHGTEVRRPRHRLPEAAGRAPVARVRTPGDSTVRNLYDEGNGGGEGADEEAGRFSGGASSWTDRM
ncbi:FAD-dependent monooxygenase [Streptomyces spirodelae]|uniref:FAD-dependent monooxygenase n=1 Tax=Streptomyces spirodelae TaxID=2812904 RepID=A0ABS3WXG1_9ACTN|nr:FAD-dependent monooxygenase [Streptomyces spirodelae]